MLLAEDAKGFVRIDHFFAKLGFFFLGFDGFDRALIGVGFSAEFGELSVEDFDIVEHADKLYYQVFRNMTKVVGIDCTMRMRCSTGITACEYMGSFMRHQSAELSIASIDADKVVSVLFRSDDKMNES